MTMPDERFRSIRWGRELLETIERDATLPSSLRERSTEIAKTYPTRQQLLQVVESDARELPVGFGSSLDNARRLFDEIQYGGIGAPDTRHHLRYTLRHFPPMGASEAAASAAWFGRLKNWIARDGDER